MVKGFGSSGSHGLGIIRHLILILKIMKTPNPDPSTLLITPTLLITNKMIMSLEQSDDR